MRFGAGMGDGFAAGFLPHLVQVCSGAYYLMYLFFDRVQSENGARYEAQMSNMQVSALRSRMEAVKAAEDGIRTERHDLRHRLQAVAELVARGDRDAALDFLDAAQKRLDEQSISAFCRRNGAVLRQITTAC